MRLLLIEDDDTLGEGLRDYLEAEGHPVQWCRSLGEAEAWQHETFDAWLVDWQLPDGSGQGWLRQRRARGASVPALMLTARDALADRILGLDSGADDYLVKPFAPEELLARLRAVTRRSAGRGDDRLELGPVQLDFSARAAWRDGLRVALTAREWAVLEALVQRRGRVVAKDDLERLVLGDTGEVVSNVLEVHVASLRRKLGRDLVLTERGMGYRLGEGA